MKRFFTLTIVLFSLFSLFSQELTLERAIEAAKENNSEYALKVKQYKQTLAMNNRSSSFIPDLSVSAGINTGATFLNPNWTTETSWTGLSYNLGLSSSLRLTGSSFMDKEIKDAKNQVALASIESDELTLERNVISSYLNLVLGKANIRVAEATLNSSKTTLENTKESYQNGLIPELNVRQAENTVNLNQLELESLKNTERLNILAFNNLTGLNFEDYDKFLDLSIISYLSLPPAQRLFMKYREKMPALKNLRATINNTSVSYKSAKNASVSPIVSLSGSYALRGQYQDNVLLTGRKDTVSDGLTASVTVSLPISSYFPSSSAKIQLDSLKNSVEDLNVTYSNTVNSLTQNLEVLVQGLSSLEAQIKNTEASLSLLEETVKLMEEAYKAGNQSYASLQNAEDSLTRTNYSLLSLKKAYLENSYNLALTLGVKLEELL